MLQEEMKTCFVIMPFGERADIAGKKVNFDDIYERFIKPAIEEAELRGVRSDEVMESGFIHRKMIEHIWLADVAIADISLLNPNVFYELGIRHSLRQSVTILLRRKGTDLPFNISNLNAVEYDETDNESMVKATAKIIEFVHSGLHNKENDSLVHEILDLQIGKRPAPLTRFDTYEYSLRNNDKRIGLVTGDLQDIRGIDIWVNSENTNMQMARFYDWSISSVIRYYGAQRDVTGHVTEDTISDELNQIMKGRLSVPAGTVIPTGAGQLQQTHDVKQLFHAASVVGEIGVGYRPIDKIERCVTNALKLADSVQFCDKKLSSILFPLLGVGTRRGDLRRDTRTLLEAALQYLDQNPSSCIEKAYFITWSKEELEMCQAILDGFTELEARLGP